ncbi:hypothetical protein ACLB2K_015337 [Fragaria x ananassa]
MKRHVVRTMVKLTLLGQSLFTSSPINRWSWSRPSGSTIKETKRQLQRLPGLPKNPKRLFGDKFSFLILE